MTHVSRYLAMLTAVVLAGGGSALAQEWKVDPDHTSISFKISHLGISTTHGRFNVMEGSFSTGEAASFDVSVEAESVDTNNKKRDDHLRSPDFFNVMQFPTITLKTTEATATEDGYQLTADLTLHGVTKSIVVDLVKVGEGEDPWGGYRAGFDAAFKINRSDYGMDNMIGAVGDEVELAISIEGVRQ